MKFAEIMETIGNFLESAIWIIGILVCYQVAFRAIGFLFKAKRFKPTDTKHHFAVLIAARNEEKVIAQLIESIKKQDYPSERIKVFVIADNCTDNTAQVAREAGAIVYERINPPPNLRKKGCALDFLIKSIEKDYGIINFDGYFIFDADNLLAPNYISEMNKAFNDYRFDFFNSYINVKNFGTSFITSFSSIGLYSATCNSTRPMSLLGLSKRKRGTGCLVRNHFLLNGYPWQNMTEDIHFSAYAISRGYRSQYCESAEFFDEQPQTLKVIMRQRMRWAKGQFILFWRYLPRLIFAIICPYDFGKKKKIAKINEKQQQDQHQSQTQKQKQVAEQSQTQGQSRTQIQTIDDQIQDETQDENKNPNQSTAHKQNLKRRKFNPITEIQKRLSAYEMLFSIAPTPLLTFIYGFAFPVAQIICKLISPSYNLNLMPTLLYYAGVYLLSLLSYFITIVREHKRMRISPWLLFCYLLFWPIIAIIIEYASLIALVQRVKWKPIPHYENKQIENIYEDKTLAERIYQK